MRKVAFSISILRNSVVGLYKLQVSYGPNVLVCADQEAATACCRILYDFAKLWLYYAYDAIDKQSGVKYCPAPDLAS